MAKSKDTLLNVLKERFESNMDRHKGVKWDAVQKKIEGKAKLLKALQAMEESGGEPDVVSFGKTIAFVDCSAQSPAERRSICFDRKALNSRKEHKPRTSAMQMAAEMGVEMLNEDEYRALQEVGEFDTKTSSWIATPDEVRELGGALFCDRRFNKVFTYHNGAESYYAGRGFRSKLVI